MRYDLTSPIHARTCADASTEKSIVNGGDAGTEESRYINCVAGVHVLASASAPAPALVVFANLDY